MAHEAMVAILIVSILFWSKKQLLYAEAEMVGSMLQPVQGRARYDDFSEDEISSSSSTILDEMSGGDIQKRLGFTSNERRGQHSAGRNRKKPDQLVRKYPALLASGDRKCTLDKEIVDLFLTAYQRHPKPSEIGVLVTIDLWVQEITAVSEVTADFELDLYITELWLDQALAYEDLQPCKQNLSLTHSVLQDLWTPNTCFVNSKAASIHHSPFQNVFIMVYPNGTVWLNYRLKVKGPCNMDLARFPMDEQSCLLTLSSFTFNTDEVKMRWNVQDPILILKEINLPDFTLTNYSPSRLEIPYPAGMWDELTVEFHFKRRMGWYFLQAYIPTYLTIFISWISFCLSANTLPARTMLGVNALLALTFQFGNIMRSLPRVSYVTAFDIWMLGCMTFIFASMLELAVVGYLSRPNVAKRSARLVAAAEATTPSTLRRCSVAVHKFRRRLSNKIRPRLTSSGSSSNTPPLRPRSLSGVSMANGNLLRDEAVVRQYLLGGDNDNVPVSPIAVQNRFDRFINGDRHEINGISVAGWVVTVDSIDQYSIIVFPTAFALFNVCYWSYCLRE